jgi:hypothetical protein
MRKFNILAVLAVLVLPFLMTGCELVGDIFRAGIWVGVLGVVALVALVVWVIGKLK